MFESNGTTACESEGQRARERAGAGTAGAEQTGACNSRDAGGIRRRAIPVRVGSTRERAA